jgi:hypothetical protein
MLIARCASERHTAADKAVMGWFAQAPVQALASSHTSTHNKHNPRAGTTTSATAPAIARAPVNWQKAHQIGHIPDADVFRVAPQLGCGR